MTGRRLGRWLAERWPFSAIAYWSLHEEIPGGSRFAYIFGSSTLFLFILQVVTGMWQMFFYVPTVDHAYQSVSYLRLQVPFGWLIHGLHYWGATAFLIMMGLHVARAFIWGAYKKPRELVWLLGVLLLLLGAMLMFTGAVLPWDLMGYWAGDVGLSIAGTVPYIGGFLKTVMQGGSSMGQLTLMRFFVLHVAILPALAALVIAAHVVAFRQFGSVGPWKAEKRRKSGWFWPDQLFKDVLVFTAVLLLLIGLSAYWRAPISGPADPLDQTYTPKPEWNFLFLYQALKAFSGPWEVVGTVGIPLLLVVLLVLPPLVDRREQRNPLKRPVAMLCGLAFAAGIVALTVLGLVSHPQTPVAASAGAAVVAPTAAPGASPQPGSALPPATEPSPATKPADAAEGQKLFTEHACNACHSITGAAGLGPDLSQEAHRGRTRQWVVAQIRHPKSHNPDTVMPTYHSLTDREVEELVSYVLSLSRSSVAAAPATGPAGPGAAALPQTQAKATPAAPVSGPSSVPGPAARLIGNAAHGQTLYSQYCHYCHGPAGHGAIESIPRLEPIRAPLRSNDAQVFADNIDRIIQHGAQSAGANPNLIMPDFGDSNALTQPQIANIEAYLLQLNGVDRAQIVHPGVPPHTFFLLCVAILAGSSAVLGGVWLVLSRKRV